MKIKGCEPCPGKESKVSPRLFRLIVFPHRREFQEAKSSEVKTGLFGYSEEGEGEDKREKCSGENTGFSKGGENHIAQCESRKA